MIVLVTAGGTRRYYHDILRVICQPIGSYLQFRYETALVVENLWKQFDTSVLGGDSCLLAYLDEYAQRKDDNLLPLRYANVVRASRHGTTASIVLELRGFAQTRSVAAFKSEVCRSSDGPIVLDGAARKFVWQPSQALTTTRESTQLEHWESVVSEIAARQLFSKEDHFFTVHRLTTANVLTTLDGTVESSHTVVPVKGRYHLRPAQEYALELYQYHPARKDMNYRVHVTSSDDVLSVVGGAPVIVDSPYDQPSVGLRSGEPTQKQEVILTVRTEGGQEGDGFRFELPCVVRGRWVRTTGYVVLVGGLLAAPQISSMSQATLRQLIIVIASSMAAAAVVAFGLKKIK